METKNLKNILVSITDQFKNRNDFLNKKRDKNYNNE